MCDGKQQTKTKTQTATVLRAMNIREVENNATVIPDCAFRQAKKKEKKNERKATPFAFPVQISLSRYELRNLVNTYIDFTTHFFCIFLFLSLFFFPIC